MVQVWTTPRHRWANAFLGGEGQRLGQSRLSGGKPRDPIVGNKKYRDCRIHGRNADQRSDLGGIERQAALSLAMPSRWRSSIISRSNRAAKPMGLI